MPLSDVTLLGLSAQSGGFELGEYAARGIKATIEPISGSKNLRRDINGTLVDLSSSIFRKYRLQLSCDDQESPGFGEISSDADGFWPGAQFTVTVLPQMASAAPMTLTMLLTTWSVDRDEWDAATSWSAEFEQV